MLRELFEEIVGCVWFFIIFVDDFITWVWNVIKSDIK